MLTKTVRTYVEKWNYSFLFHFYCYSDLRRNLDENIAQKLIEDAQQCITSHLGDCDQRDWNPEIYKGDLEMTAQTIEQTCDIEFGKQMTNG